MTILVTGAGGFVARHLAEALKVSRADETVRGLVRKQDDFAKAHERGFEPVLGDVTDRASVDEAMQSVDTVIHLAAINRERGKSTFEAVNYQGTLNMIEAAKAQGVTRLLNLVGLGADPTRPQGLPSTQGRALEAIRASDLDYTLFEASVIFGAGDEFINTLAGLALVPPVMVVPGDGKARFEPIWAGDVAACLVKALDDMAAVNQSYYLCGPQVMTLEEIIDAIMAEMEVRRIKVRMPAVLLGPPVWLMDKLLAKPPATPALLGLLGEDNVGSECATTEVFGVEPRRMADGLGFVNEMTLGQLVRRSLLGEDYS